MVDWNAPAKLIERDDDGSELAFHFTELKSGSLSSLVGEVMAMPTMARARVLIDAAGQGTFNVGDIVGLAARDDFPAAG
ncbi:MAG: hypothetical protein RLZZ366_1780 [Pseudomonadota bacterium]